MLCQLQLPLSSDALLHPSLLQPPLYSLRGIVTFDHVLWETMEWMVIISAMNVHPSLGMFILIHLYLLHLELSL